MSQPSGIPLPSLPGPVGNDLGDVSHNDFSDFLEGDDLFGEIDEGLALKTPAVHDGTFPGLTSPVNSSACAGAGAEQQADSDIMVDPQLLEGIFDIPQDEGNADEPVMASVEFDQVAQPQPSRPQSQGRNQLLEWDPNLDLLSGLDSVDDAWISDSIMDSSQLSDSVMNLDGGKVCGQPDFATTASGPMNNPFTYQPISLPTYQPIPLPTCQPELLQSPPKTRATTTDFDFEFDFDCVYPPPPSLPALSLPVTRAPTPPRLLEQQRQMQQQDVTSQPRLALLGGPVMESSVAPSRAPSRTASPPPRIEDLPVKDYHKLGRIPARTKDRENFDYGDYYDLPSQLGLKQMQPLNPVLREKFSYTREGEWKYKQYFTRDELLGYMNDRKSRQLPLRMWVQNHPAQCNNRGTRSAFARQCRWAECPDKNHTILKGFWRVTFDERPELTGERVDPFVNAGYMHLWCFEQCFDPVEIIRDFDVQPDTRHFEREERNMMSLTRDHSEMLAAYNDWKRAQNASWRAWQQSRNTGHLSDNGAMGRPVKKEDKLWYALTATHLSLESKARQTTRDDRGGASIDKHKGDLALFLRLKTGAGRQDKQRGRRPSVIDLTGQQPSSSSRARRGSLRLQVSSPTTPRRTSARLANARRQSEVDTQDVMVARDGDDDAASPSSVLAAGPSSTCGGSAARTTRNARTGQQFAIQPAPRSRNSRQRHQQAQLENGEEIAAKATTAVAEGPPSPVQFRTPKTPTFARRSERLMSIAISPKTKEPPRRKRLHVNFDDVARANIDRAKRRCPSLKPFPFAGRRHSTPSRSQKVVEG